MNFYKLALKNVKQMISRYYLYFLSLGLLATFYYIFAAMSENIHLDELVGITGLSGGEFLMLGTLFMYLFVFTFIFFTNRFFLRRRWHEIGLYRFLGIKRRQISLLLLLEVLLLMSAALLLGLILGVLLSKLFAMILLKVVGSPQDTSLLFSIEAIKQTVRMFGYITIFVILYNTWYLYRHRLVDLLKKEQRHAYPKKIRVMDFLGSSLAIGCLVYGFSLANRYATKYQNYFRTNQSTILDNQVFTHPFLILFLIIIGTLFFFYSFLPLLLIFLTKWHKIYYRNLRVFTIDRLISYLRSYGIVLSVVSILCGFSLSVLGGAALLIETLNKYEKTQLKYNYVVSKDYYTQFEKIKKNYPDLQTEGHQMISFKILPAKITFGVKKSNELVTPINIVSFEKFREIYEVKKRREIPMLLTQAGSAIDPKEVNLQLANGQGDFEQVIIENGWQQAFNLSYETPYLFVLPQSDYEKIAAPDYSLAFVNLAQQDLFHPQIQQFDKELDQQNHVVGQLAFSVSEEKKQLVAEQLFEPKNQTLSKSKNEYLFTLKQQGVTIQDLNLNSFRVISGTLLFVTIFLGLLFLAASGSLIMVKQLSTAEEEKRNYRVLQYIGVPKNKLQRSVEIQNICLFFLPVILSLTDCYFALKMYRVFVTFERIGGLLVIFSGVLIFYIVFQIITTKHYIATVLNIR